MKSIKVCWLSAGVSSFIAGYLDKENIDKFIYIDVADQHPDSLRFIHDCEAILGKHIDIIKSSKYANVEEAVLAFGGFINRKTFFSPCTKPFKCYIYCTKERMPIKKKW